MIENYPETFCSTSIEDIKIAMTGGQRESHTSDFTLFPQTYVTHQGVTIFCLAKPNGRGQDVLITQNPLIVKTLEKAGYSTMKSFGPSGERTVEAGTPLANGLTEGAAPYLKNFFKSPQVAEENLRLKRNALVESINREAEYTNDEDFKRRFGFTKEEYKTRTDDLTFLKQARLI